MQENKLNLHIYGIHLLNPYKTIVSHLKPKFSKGRSRIRTLLLNKRQFPWLCEAESEFVQYVVRPSQRPKY